jgi:hypothetical protein
LPIELAAQSLPESKVPPSSAQQNAVSPMLSDPSLGTTHLHAWTEKIVVAAMSIKLTSLILDVERFDLV